jgi:hypothetical protein
VVGGGGKGGAMYVENVFEELDEAGEFFLDTTGGAAAGACGGRNGSAAGGSAAGGSAALLYVASNSTLGELQATVVFVRPTRLSPPPLIARPIAPPPPWLPPAARGARPPLEGPLTATAR